MSNLDPDKSPTGSKISISTDNAKGVRSINKLPVIFLVGIVCIVLFIMVYAMLDRSSTARNVKDYNQAAVAGSENAARNLVQDYQNFGEIEARPKNEPGQTETQQAETQQAETPQTETQQAETQPLDALPAKPTKSAKELEEEDRVRQIRIKSWETALNSPLRVELRMDDELSKQKQDAVSGAASTPYASDQQALMAMAMKSQGLGFEGDPNLQLRKESFLNENRLPTTYNPHLTKDLISPYEIKTGTIIPGVLVTGLNSDLPGQIIGQVSQNVYDSARGDHLLIPQGTKIIGVYDSQIAMGQTRALVAWTRLVFPNGSTLELGSMPGADQVGYAGMSDQIDNHYLRIFGNAFLLSLITAGTAMAIPDDDKNSNSNTSASEEVKIAIAQQMGQVGAAMLQKGLNIQPTLEIRPGYRFFLVVNKDIILRPW